MDIVSMQAMPRGSNYYVVVWDFHNTHTIMLG